MRSVKDECLSKLILFGEPALRTALRAYVEHFHGERTHQGKGNLPLVSTGGGSQDRSSALPRTPRGTAEVLPSGGRMSFLTLRATTRRKRMAAAWQGQTDVWAGLKVLVECQASLVTSSREPPNRHGFHQLSAR